MPARETSPARASSARSRVYDLLREAIVSLRLKPHERISHDALAEQLGVSRTPVREALLQLAEEGLIELRPQSATFVAPISLDAVREAQFIREALEVAAVRTAIDRVGDRELAQLDANLAAQREADATRDTDRFYALDEALHRSLMEFSGFPGAWRIAEQSRAQLNRVRILSLPGHDVIDRLVAQHTEIIERLRTGDGAGAEAVMRDHLRLVYKDLPEIERQHPDYFARPASADPIAAARGQGRRASRARRGTEEEIDAAR